MLQRRINNWITVSDRGIKCLEVLSCVHTSGIGAFYTFRDIFRRTFDRPSGIRWCWYPAETINENRRRVLTKLFDGFCFVSVGDVRTMRSSSSIPSTGWIVSIINRAVMRMIEKIMNYRFDGSRVFFTSDTHFNHTNIIRFCNRPFKDVSHMNETIISNWNRVVGPEDIVFHLGDFCLGGSTEWVNVLNRLNGKYTLFLATTTSRT